MKGNYVNCVTTRQMLYSFQEIKKYPFTKAEKALRVSPANLKIVTFPMSVLEDNNMIVNLGKKDRFL